MNQTKSNSRHQSRLWFGFDEMKWINGAQSNLSPLGQHNNITSAIPFGFISSLCRIWFSFWCGIKSNKRQKKKLNGRMRMEWASCGSLFIQSHFKIKFRMKSNWNSKPLWISMNLIVWIEGLIWWSSQLMNFKSLESGWIN